MDGHLVSSIRLSSGAGPYGQPGYIRMDDEAHLDSVRGHPGQIAHWINRGDPVGEQVAEWTEGGVSWTATSGLDVQALGTALARLQLQRDHVTDPSGRFRVLGSDVGPHAGRERTTDLEIDQSKGPSGAARTYYVRVSMHVAGTTGLMSLPEGANTPGGPVADREHGAGPPGAGIHVVGRDDLG